MVSSTSNCARSSFMILTTRVRRCTTRTWSISWTVCAPNARCTHQSSCRICLNLRSHEGRQRGARGRAGGRPAAARARQRAAQARRRRGIIREAAHSWARARARAPELVRLMGDDEEQLVVRRGLARVALDAGARLLAGEQPPDAQVVTVVAVRARALRRRLGDRRAMPQGAHAAAAVDAAVAPLALHWRAIPQGAPAAASSLVHALRRRAVPQGARHGAYAAHGPEVRLEGGV